MKNFINKIEGDAGAAGEVDADEYNSLMKEAKGLVSPFLALNDSVNDQAVKAMDIASKAMFYTDVGQVNAVNLTRGATTSQIETLFEGMVVLFQPGHQNTSARATLTMPGLTPKPMIGAFGGSSLSIGYLKIHTTYIAIYSSHAENFYVEPLTPNVSHLIALLNTGTGLSAANATRATYATSAGSATSATNASYAQRLGSSRESPDQIVSNRVAVITGNFFNIRSFTLPLPTGFSSSQCKFFYFRQRATYYNYGFSAGVERTVYENNNVVNGAYIVIGVK